VQEQQPHRALQVGTPLLAGSSVLASFAYCLLDVAV